MIYLDNAATTLMKPNAVLARMADCMEHFCANSGRGGHRLSLMAGERVYQCREKLAQLFHIAAPERIAFTNNTTTALNYAIQGCIKPGGHVVIGGMEHNSVLRPVVHSGMDYTVAQADETGMVSADSVRQALRDNTCLIVINHASNVTGAISPVGEIGAVAKARGIPLLVDAAQSAGVVDIDVERDHISMLAFAGHKMLYGPTGTGGLYVAPEIRLTPVIQGGTGSLSEWDVQPDFMPDMLESGTLNTVGIVGLSAGVDYVLKETVAGIHQREMALIAPLIDGLSNIPGATVLGGAERVGVVGFTLEGHGSVTVCNLLDEEFAIASRGGLHCAVLAHRSLGTERLGVVRLSVSNFTTVREIHRAVDGVNRIAKKLN